MTGPLQGAYVQAWVWVDLEPREHWPDSAIRERAVAEYGHDGSVEIDADAPISRSYGEG